MIKLNYEVLLSESDSIGLTVKEKPLKYNDGRIKGNRIAIRKDLSTSAEKACVLAEELGHYYTSTGDILDQSSVANRKQERHSRLWAYNRMIGLNGIVSAHKAGCRNSYEVAEYLNTTEEFLLDAIQCYRNKYGCFTQLDNYVIYFEPSIGVFELI